jgi:hypothetical protein
VDPRDGLDDMVKRKFLTLPGLELRPLSRPARGQSLYRLRYPGFSFAPWTFSFQILASLFRASKRFVVSSRMTVSVLKCVQVGLFCVYDHSLTHSWS